MHVSWGGGVAFLDKTVESCITDSPVLRGQVDTPLQNQKAVTAHFKRKQLLPFDFARKMLGVKHIFVKLGVGDAG